MKLFARIAARVGRVGNGTAEKSAQRLPTATDLDYEQAIGADASPNGLVVALVDGDGVSSVVQPAIEGPMEDQFAGHGAMGARFAVAWIRCG